MIKTPIHHPDDQELLGFIEQQSAGWVALTLFGYVMQRTETRQAAEAVVREQGLPYLKGIWQYYDTDQHDWFPCVITDANQQRVTIVRTNTLGFQTKDDFKMMILEHPTEEQLVKSA